MTRFLHRRLLMVLFLITAMPAMAAEPRKVTPFTAPDDIENFTNRSPYPTLHLLREASVARAVAAHPDTEKIYEDNIAALRRLGRQGWDELGLTPDAVQGGRPPAIEGTLRGSE